MWVKKNMDGKGAIKLNNIFAWYPFKEGAKILVLFGECGQRVDLEIQDVVYATSCEELTSDALFDYIIIHDGFPEDITVVGRHLKHNGKMVITAANPLSVSYSLQVRTYFKNILTKSQFEKKLTGTGLRILKYYYPYPNHYYPIEFFTDKTINDLQYGRETYNFLPGLLGKDDLEVEVALLQEEKVLDKMVNSFMVEIVHDNYAVEDEEILYVKLSDNRKEEFRISTQIIERCGKRYVYKKTLSTKGKKHLEQMHCHDSIVIDKKIYFLNSEEIEGGYAYPFLTGENLDRKIEVCVRSSSGESVKQILRDFWQIVLDNSGEKKYVTPEFKKVFGECRSDDMQLCMSPFNIDLICENIFETEKGYYVIDNEWTFDFAIPIRFAIWRCIHELYQKHFSLRQLITEANILEEYDISSDDVKQYEQWNRHFTLDYVGTGLLEGRAEPVERPMSIKNEVDEESYLYFDCGDGYSEQNMMSVPLQTTQGYFDISFYVSDFRDIQQMRWNPLKGRMCSCDVICEIDGSEQKNLSSNAIMMAEEGGIFITTFPEFIYDVEESQGVCSVVRFYGRIIILDRERVKRTVESIEERYRRYRWYAGILEDDGADLRRKLSQGREELEQKEIRWHTHYEEIEKELYDIKSSKSWKMIEKFRSLRDGLRRKV